MTPDPPGDGGQSAGNHEDLGEPVAQLLGLTLAVDDRFGRRVRGRIERRVLAGELFGLAWTAPMMMFLEFLQAAFGLLGGKRSGDGARGLRDAAADPSDRP